MDAEFWRSGICFLKLLWVLEGRLTSMLEELPNDFIDFGLLALAQCRGVHGCRPAHHAARRVEH